MIQKITHAEFQNIVKLKQKKYREESNLFLGEGVNFLIEIAKNKQWIDRILVTEEFYNSNSVFLKKFIPNIFFVSSKDLEKVSETVHNQPILTVLQNIYSDTEFKLKDQKRILYLYHLQDPGNAGTLVRTASWFGWDTIIFSGNSVEWTNPKVIRATMGAFQNIEIYQDDQDLTLLKKLSLAAETLLLDMNGIEIRDYKIDPQKRLVVVIGNESNGFQDFPHNLVKSINCSIPGFPQNVESLNASVAGSIALYEFRNVE